MTDYKKLIIFSILSFLLSSSFWVYASDKLDGDFYEFKALIGKKLPKNFKTLGSGLIGNDIKLIILVSQMLDNKFVILKSFEKDKQSIVTDIMKQPILSPGESFLYASCSTRADLSIIDAIGIVDYDPRKEKFIAKKSWIIDYKSKKIIKNNGIKIYCVNESFTEPRE